jgi:hypothetical protein
MRFAMWTYAWDVLDLGFDAVIAEMKERAGLNGINLATAYHAGRFLQPRSPRHKVYFPEDGTVYFRPDPARWSGRAIVPKLASIVDERGDVLRDLIQRRDKTGLSVACWTVCLHNMRLGQMHPQACIRNAFGDIHPFNLCPSHPDARAYVVNLVADLSHNYRPDAVQLESPWFMGYAHDYHHEKDAVGLLPEDDYLLSLCFCDACLARAKRAGVDGEAARRTVRRWIEDLTERAVPVQRWPDFATRGPAVFADHPEVQAYVLWRFEPVTSLMGEIRAAAHPEVKVHMLDDVRHAWLAGGDIAALARACDGVVSCAYDRSAEAVGADLAATRAAIGPQPFLGAGMRVGYPEMKGPDDLASRSRAAAKAGATEINYYNYGLIPAARLDWVRAGVEAASRR